MIISQKDQQHFCLQLLNLLSSPMKAKGRKRSQAPRQNIFEDDDDNEMPPADEVANEMTVSNDSQPTSKKVISRANQLYTATKIQQNEHYIGKAEKDTELTNQQQGKMKSKGRRKLAKKKNLFDSDEDQNQQQPSVEDAIEETTQSNLTTQIKSGSGSGTIEQSIRNSQGPTVKAALHPVSFSDQEDQIVDSHTDTPQQENQIVKKVKMMVQEQEEQKEKSEVETSFSKLVEKAGSNKDELKKLVYEAIPQGCRAVCVFKRVSNGFTESYQLQLDDGERTIFFCQNQRIAIGANYYISLTKQMDKTSPAYLGKLRGNSTGSVYQLYDAGKQPEASVNRKNWRVSMARIEYESNFLGINGPRKLEVIVPKAETISDLDSFKLAQNQELTSFQPPTVLKFRNKQPRWNQRLRSYALNFGGRVKQASIKNFILVNNKATVQEQLAYPNSLIFGKIDENSFSLEVVHPLSLYQAFGIVMSQFDFKLKCQ